MQGNRRQNCHRPSLFTTEHEAFGDSDHLLLNETEIALLRILMDGDEEASLHL